MQRTIGIARILAIALVLAALPVVIAGAQGPNEPGPGTWNSAFTIQNLGSVQANVVADIYDEAGNVVYTKNMTIPPGQGDFTYVGNLNIPEGRYSVVISSDQPVVAVTNLSSENPVTAGAYGGFTGDQVATTLYAPGVYKEYYGFGSNIVVQNAGTADANVQIQYLDASGSVVDTESGTIKPGASKTFNQAANANLPSGFIGSAVISSTNDQNLAAEVNVWSSSGLGLFSNYNAFSSGSTVAYTPVLMNNYYNFITALTVQCIDTVACDVRVTYSTGHTVSNTVQPNTAWLLYQPNDAALPSGNANGLFSAKIESTNGRSIVALVNEQDQANGRLASYNGFISGATTAYAPVVLKHYYNYFSSITAQNVGSTTADITVTYSNGASETVQNVAPGDSALFYQPNNASLPDGFNGSATITSSSDIVVIVNENTSRQIGDDLLAYNGFSQ